MGLCRSLQRTCLQPQSSKRFHGERPDSRCWLERGGFPEMRPSLTGDNALSKSERNTETLSKTFVSKFTALVSGSNLSNLHFGKFVKWMIFSTLSYAPTLSPEPSESFGLFMKPSFFKSILNVLFRCSKKEMRWPNALGIVAIVAHLHADWYRTTIGFLPRVSMCINWIVSFFQPCHSVSSGCFSSSPQPARTKMWHVYRNWSVFVDVIPKPF